MTLAVFAFFCGYINLKLDSFAADKGRAFVEKEFGQRILIRAIIIRSDLIPLNPLFQHSSIPSLRYVRLRHSQFSLTSLSFRPVGPTARRENQVFDNGIVAG